MMSLVETQPQQTQTLKRFYNAFVNSTRLCDYCAMSEITPQDILDQTRQLVTARIVPKYRHALQETVASNDWWMEGDCPEDLREEMMARNAEIALVGETMLVVVANSTDYGDYRYFGIGSVMLRGAECSILEHTIEPMAVRNIKNGETFAPRDFIDPNDPAAEQWLLDEEQVALVLSLADQYPLQKAI